MNIAYCPFCKRNWHLLRHVEPYEGKGSITVIHPPKPVTEGHVLVISDHHCIDAAENPKIAAELMFRAATYVRQNRMQANIVTCVGHVADQTVMHLHVHVIPRKEGDGLTLPWAEQEKK